MADHEHQKPYICPNVLITRGDAETERRSITVQKDLSRRIQNLRAFILSQGVEIDYTNAINFSVDLGLDRLSETGFDDRVTELLSRHIALDEDSKRALAQRWAMWRSQNDWTISPESTETIEMRQAGRSRETMALPQKPLKRIIARCMKCKTNRDMRNPQATTFRNGTKGYTGFCPVCGSKMAKIGK